MKTFSAKSSDINRNWYIVDASKYPMGRLCTVIAGVLMGKQKTTYTPHIEAGDYVIVINSDKLQVSGQKLTDKNYYRHSQYPGSLKTLSLQEMIDKDSTKVIKLAVKRMLPDNKLRDPRIARLKVYKDAEHGHAAQTPENLKVGDMK